MIADRSNAYDSCVAIGELIGMSDKI